MGRTIVKCKYTNFDGLQERISNLLRQRRYKHMTEYIEDVWNCGVVLKKYIQIEFAEINSLVISAWVRDIGCDEQDLNGILYLVPKKQVRNVVNEIQTLVKYEQVN